MGSTKVELVALLRERQGRGKDRSHALARVIERARAGVYHDWDSDLDTPKIQLVNDLSAVKRVDLSDIIEKVKEGEFDDEPPTAQQLEELRQSVGAEVYDKLFPEDAKRRGQA